MSNKIDNVISEKIDNMMFNIINKIIEFIHLSDKQEDKLYDKPSIPKIIGLYLSGKGYEIYSKSYKSNDCEIFKIREIDRFGKDNKIKTGLQFYNYSKSGLNYPNKRCTVLVEVYHPKSLYLDEHKICYYIESFKIPKCIIDNVKQKADEEFLFFSNEKTKENCEN